MAANIVGDSLDTDSAQPEAASGRLMNLVVLTRHSAWAFSGTDLPYLVCPVQENRAMVSGYCHASPRASKLAVAAHHDHRET